MIDSRRARLAKQGGLFPPELHWIRSSPACQAAAGAGSMEGTHGDGGRAVASLLPGWAISALKPARKQHVRPASETRSRHGLRVSIGVRRGLGRVAVRIRYGRHLRRHRLHGGTLQPRRNPKGLGGLVRPAGLHPGRRGGRSAQRRLGTQESFAPFRRVIHGLGPRRGRCRPT